jgi:Holliday junction resolvase-like predicted endonuclease
MTGQAYGPPQNLSFNEVCAAIMELRESQKETSRQIGRLGSHIGDLIEHLTAANLPEHFKALGYEFTRISRNNKLKDANNQTLAEIDIILENGDFAMVVEVKSLLALADVKDHIKRMEILRQYADAHKDTRKYVSSVSGALIEDEAGTFALDRGIYVIEHAGDAIQIRAPQKVRTW